ncbi:MAG: glycoside hydrolase family 97 C-terminal domain-containing protein, partial [Leptospiraceae bacterium]|nr:glycoside hydrolase family 97 C-terminal domain-containing protein [Leptospiraceae bacterium]
VKGAEWYQFPVFRGPNAADNVYYALVRNVVGHVDFTPVFEQPLKQQKISYAHAFALPVILESGIQHLAGKADDAQSGYRKLFNEYPFMKDFLRILPAFWDETRLLHAHPQSHVVVARRNGKRWFVAAISSAEKELVLDLPLGFLPKDMPFLAIVEGEKPDQLRQYKTQAGELSRLVLKPRGGAVFYSE